jgi:hypothetical protein
LEERLRQRVPAQRKVDLAESLQALRHVRMVGS